MLSNFITRFNKIELHNVEKDGEKQGDEKGKTYISSVYDVLSEDTLEITMPMEKTKLILLPVDSERQPVSMLCKNY